MYSIFISIQFNVLVLFDFLKHPLSHGLFRSFLFNLQVFEEFLFLLLISSLISSLIPFWLEHTLYDFNYFKFAEVCFMAPDVVYLGIWSVDT